MVVGVRGQTVHGVFFSQKTQVKKMPATVEDFPGGPVA